MSGHVLDTAVVLAAGRGTRMRAPGADVPLEPEQAEWAELGLKPLIPFGGTPFIAYVLSALADAGFARVCMVTAAGADPVARALAALRPARLEVVTAVQPEPRGSADALLAAEPFIPRAGCAVINADNYYTPAALRLLRELTGSGLVAFRASALVERGNVTTARLAGYALITTRDGLLTGIIEKPGADAIRQAGGDALISMTCWRFDRTVFAACRAVAPSARGELELPDAVRLLVRGGAALHVAVSDEAVLDLSERGDIASVALHLAGVRVQP